MSQCEGSMWGPTLISNAGKYATFAAIIIAVSACQTGDSATTDEDDLATSPFIGPMQCEIALAEGPPEKPERLSAFGTATAWNVGRSVGRNMITGAGTAVAGPVGGAVAGGVAARALPSEFDIRGNWTTTDGTPNCGCGLTLSAQSGWSGTNPPRGTAEPSGCRNSLMATANDWRLDETMTGLEAELLIYAENGNRIAVLNRDGPDYYSGRLSNGSPVAIWRE